MGTEAERQNTRMAAERQDTRKAMAYDLIRILKEKPEKESYTTEEIEKIIHVYLTTADQK